MAISGVTNGGFQARAQAVSQLNQGNEVEQAQAQTRGGASQEAGEVAETARNSEDNVRTESLNFAEARASENSGQDFNRAPQTSNSRNFQNLGSSVGQNVNILA